MTSLTERECEVRISLSGDITQDIVEPGLAGVYQAEGICRWGRPVFRHSGGEFTLSVYGGGYWMVSSGVGGAGYLSSRTAPSMCPADPRAARSEMWGWTHWMYRSKRGGFEESGDNSVACNKH